MLRDAAWVCVVLDEHCCVGLYGVAGEDKFVNERVDDTCIIVTHNYHLDSRRGPHHSLLASLPFIRKLFEKDVANVFMLSLFKL